MKRTLKQLVKFAIIGSGAAAVNMLVVIFLVETFLPYPLIANIFAFLIAFNVSYFGHYYWSFAGDVSKKHQQTAHKFFLVAGVSFLLNEGLFWLFLSLFQLYYILALLLVLLIVPLFTFVVSKVWVFT